MHSVSGWHVVHGMSGQNAVHGVSRQNVVSELHVVHGVVNCMLCMAW